MNFDLYNIDKSPFWEKCTEIKQICKPFFDQVGITYFDYARFYPDYTSIILFTSSEYLRFFLLNKNYKCPVGYMLPGRYLWHSYISNEFLEIVNQNFNVFHGITVIRDRHEYKELFNFAAPKNNKVILDIFLNNQAILEYFVTFFLKQNEELFSKHQNTKIIMPDSVIKPPTGTYNEQISLSDLIRIMQHDNKKLKNKIILNINKQLITLSIRETQCLTLIIAGNTSKQIANILDISSRTVDAFIKSILEKTNAFNRVDLLSKLDNNFLDLLKKLNLEIKTDSASV